MSPAIAAAICCVLAFVPGGLNAAPIERDRAQVRAFRADHPCPATGQIRGACPGYHVDHIIPLCAGGQDRPANMQWITREDHKWKTFVDVRECRKLRRKAAQPAHAPAQNQTSR